jgi:hypothetical protein
MVLEGTDRLFKELIANQMVGGMAKTYPDRNRGLYRNAM